MVRAGQRVTERGHHETGVFEGVLWPSVSNQPGIKVAGGDSLVWMPVVRTHTHTQAHTCIHTYAHTCAHAHTHRMDGRVFSKEAVSGGARIFRVLMVQA